MKVVFITGASSGIGEALAREYALEGYRLVLCGRRMDRLSAISSELRQLGADCLPISCDVTIAQDMIEAVSAAVRHFGRIDIVIANAGYSEVGVFDSLPLEAFHRQFDTNVFGVIHTIQAALEPLKKNRGRLAIVGSVLCYISTPRLSAYSMSKGAIRALSETLHVELRAHGINVTLICPGTIATDMSKVAPTNDRLRAAIRNWLAIPADRAAFQIRRGIDSGRREVVITVHGKVLILMQRLTPWLMPWVMRFKDSVFAARARTAEEQHA